MSGEFIKIPTSKRDYQESTIKQYKSPLLQQQVGARYKQYFNLRTSPKILSKVLEDQQCQLLLSDDDEGQENVVLKFRDTDKTLQERVDERNKQLYISNVKEEYQSLINSNVSNELTMSASSPSVVRELLCLESDTQFVQKSGDSLLQKIQKQIHQANPKAWGVGGVSTIELRERFLQPRRNDQQMPYNTSRQTFLDLLKHMFEFKNKLLDVLMKEQFIAVFYRQFEDIWPETTYWLVPQLNIQIPLSRVVFQHLPVRNLEYFLSNRKQQVENIQKTVLSAMQNRFTRQLNDIIISLFDNNRFDPNTKYENKLLTLYKHIKGDVPSSICQKSFFDAGFQYRMGDKTAEADVMRYLEAIAKNIDLRDLFDYIPAGNEKMKKIVLIVCSALTVRVGTAIATLFEEIFMRPLEQALNTYQDHNVLVQQAMSNKSSSILQELRDALFSLKFNSPVDLVSENAMSEFQRFAAHQADQMGVGLLSPGSLRQIRYKYENRMDQSVVPANRKPKGIELSIAFKCAKIAAVKAVEERFPIILQRTEGKHWEQRMIQWVDDVAELGD